MSLAELEDKFTEEELTNYGTLFASVDEDSSGSIDVDELGVLLEAIGQKVSSREELQAIVDEVDDDGSGEIEYIEFLSIMWNLKSGNKSSKLASSMSSALSSNIFPKSGIKSPFKLKTPSNTRQLWSSDEEDRTRWILAIEECITSMKEGIEAQKQRKRERKKKKKERRKKKKQGDKEVGHPPGLDTYGAPKGIADESSRHRGDSGAVNDFAPVEAATPKPTDLAGIIEAEAAIPPPSPAASPLSSLPPRPKEAKIRTTSQEPNLSLGVSPSLNSKKSPQISSPGPARTTNPAPTQGATPATSLSETPSIAKTEKPLRSTRSNKTTFSPPTPVLPSLLGKATTPSRMHKERLQHVAASTETLTRKVVESSSSPSPPFTVPTVVTAPTPTPPPPPPHSQPSPSNASPATVTGPVKKVSSERHRNAGAGRNSATPERRQVVPTSTIQSQPSLVPVREGVDRAITSKAASATANAAPSPLPSQPSSPPSTTTTNQPPPPSFVVGANPEDEDRLSREKEDLQNQLMMVIRMNEELNSSLEKANEDHTNEVSTLRAHLEVLNSELDLSKTKKHSNLKTLDEEILRLEAEVDSLRELATSSQTKEEMAKNKLDRSQMRLQNAEKELKGEAEKVKAMSNEISLLKEMKDVLESELEATTSKAETIWSSPLKKKASSSKSRFQIDDENEKAIESLKKENKKIKAQVENLTKSNSELERRLLTEDGDDFPAYEIELDAAQSDLDKRKNENKVLTAKIGLLEGELNTLRTEQQNWTDQQEGNIVENDIFLNLSNPSQLSPPSSPPPPPPPEEDLEEELRNTRLQAEKWQQAALAAANVAIEAASVQDPNESLFDLTSSSIDVDVLMERISVLESYRSEGVGEVESMNERLKAAEKKLEAMGEENRDLKSEVEGLNEKKATLGTEVDELRQRIRAAEEHKVNKQDTQQISAREETTMMKNKVKELESLNETLLKKNNELQQSSNDLDVEVVRRSAASIDLSNKFTAAEKEISLMRRDSTSLEEQRTQLEEDVKALKEDLKRGEGREEELLSVVHSLQREKEDASRQAEAEKRQIRRSSVQESLTKEQQRLEELKTLQSAVEEKDEELGNLRREAAEWKQRQKVLESLRKSEKHLLANADKLKSEISSISDTNKSLTFQLNQTASDTGMKSEQLMKHKAELKILKAKHAESENKYMRATGELEVARDELASQEKFILESGMTHRGVVAKLKGINEGVVKENKAHLSKIDRLMSKCERLEGVAVENEELRRLVGEGTERSSGLESAIVKLEERFRKAQREGETLRKKLLDEFAERREEGEVWGGKEKAWAEEKEGLLEEVKKKEKKSTNIVGDVTLELEKVRKERNNLKAEVDESNATIERIEKKLEGREAEFEQLETDIAGLQRGLKRSQEELGLKVNFASQLENEKELEANLAGQEIERLRGNARGLKSTLQSKEGELRMAAISAQEAQEKVRGLTAEVEAIGVDLGIRVKELEGDCREERTGRLEAERELRSLRIKCDGLEGKVKNFGDSLAKEKRGGNEMGDELVKLEGELTTTREEMTSRVLELEGKLSKESSLRKAGERREKSFKSDLSVLSSEMVEMNRKIDEYVGEIEEKDMLVKGLEKELEGIKIKERKAKELQRLRGNRIEEEEYRMRGELGELERQLGATQGECKGLKAELRRSRISRSGGLAGVAPGRREREEEEEEDRGGLDLNLSYVSRSGGMNRSDLGYQRGGEHDVEGDDIDFDLTVSKGGASILGESWRTRSKKEMRLAEQLQREMGKR